MKYLSEDDVSAFLQFLLAAKVCAPEPEPGEESDDPDFPLLAPIAIAPIPFCPSPAVLGEWGGMIESHLERWWGGSFLPTTYTEKYRATRLGRTCLRRYPVISVSTTEALYAGADHELERMPVPGYIWDGGSQLMDLFPETNHEITYVAGFDPLPTGLIDLIKLLLIKSIQEGGLAFLTNPFTDVTSLSIGGLSQSGQLSDGMEFLDTIRRYKRSLFF